MNKAKLFTMAGVAGIAAVPATLLVAPAANADAEKHGRCAGATYELDVDRERGGFEVNADIDDARPGSKWRVVLRHDGKVIHRAVHRADFEGEVEVERFRHNTAGKDVFKLTVDRLGNHRACSSVVTLR